MTWSCNDLFTLVHGAPQPATGVLTAYACKFYTDTRHVLYRGSANSNIYELWWMDSIWHLNDLTHAAGAPAMGPGSHLIGFGDNSTQTEHVLFVDPGGDLYELRWERPVGWSAYNLTVTISVPAPLPTTEFAAWIDDTGGKVVYQDVTNAIYQLDWSGGIWHFSLLLSSGLASGGTTLTGYSGLSLGPGATSSAEYVGFQVVGSKVEQLSRPIPSGTPYLYPPFPVSVSVPTSLTSHNQEKVIWIPDPHDPKVRHPTPIAIPRLQCIAVGSDIWNFSLPNTTTGVNLTSLAKAPPSNQITLIGWFSPISKSNEVFYITGNGQVMLITWDDDAGTFSPVPCNLAVAPLAGYYWDETTTEYVYYIGEPQHIYEVSRSSV